MTTIQYNNQMTDEQYRDRRYNVLLWLETVGGKVDLTAYTDNPNGGYATIGAGFKIDSNWDAILKALGFNTTKDASEAEKAYISQIQALVGKDRKFTTSQMTTLITDINKIMQKRAEDPNVTNAISGQNKRTEFKFNDEPEVQTTFQVIADDREKTLCKWLGENYLTSKYSIVPRGNERIALLSLVYNNVIGFKDNAQTIAKSSNLLNAIKSGNRAEAWFEIRYNSNKPGTGLEDGIAKRRYYESQLFGLYNNPQSVDAEEAKQTYRMLQLHRDKIYAYEANFGTNPNGGSPDDNSPDSNASSRIKVANADYNLTGDAQVQTLTQILDSAKNAMLTYLQGLHPQLGQLSVDRAIDIYLDPGRDKSGETFNPNHSATLDARSGDSRKSRDILIGEGGTDHLWGGKGDDILLGGTGYDYYYYRIGDGNDTIIDEDNQGKIVIQKQGTQGLETITVGNLYKVGSTNIWKDASGKITVTHNSPYKITLEDGSTIELGENFQDGDFGIRLLDAPNNPAINNTIIVDEQYNGTTYDTPANDLIVGTSGNDGIIGGWHGGNDWILGGDGSDAISTGSGIVEGGASSDIIAGGHDDSKLFGENYGEMEDLITAGESAPNINTKGDLVSGNDGNDQVYGSNANDALFGGYGHDLLVGGGGDDAIFGDGECSGGERNWSFTITPGVMVNLSNMVYGTGTFKGNDAIYAGMGNDFVYAGGGGDEVYAGDGDDTVIGEGGDDFIDGSTGNDILEGDAPWVPVSDHGSDYIDGGSGNDKIWGGAGSDDMFGGDGNDEIYGDNTDDIGSGDDYLDGEAGDDKLVGYGGDDTLFGGDGNDYLEGDNGVIGSGNDYLDGEAGNDTLLGNAGNDEVFGGDGDDWLQGDEGDDYLDGEAGDDILLGVNGNDQMYGGEGNDHLQGDAGNDYLAGGAGDDVLVGVDGDDEIYGGEGNDQIWGGTGDDVISGGSGNDTIYGEAGNDTYVFNLGDGGDTIYDFPQQLNSGSSDTIQFGEGIRKEDIDFVKDGGDLEIRINGTEDSIRVKNWFYLENNRVGQSEFADGTMLTSADIDTTGYKVYGSVGDDDIQGSSGKDYMYGYEGNDILHGNWGDDILDGGDGNDYMMGESGNDVYRFGIGSGHDTINDYGHGDITGIIDRNKIDTLEFGAGITMDDLELIREGDDLKINIKGTTDTLTIQKWFNTGDYYRVEQFKFSDGSVLEVGVIEAAGYKVPGTSGNDTLEGGLGSDTLDGGMGDDNLYGNSGNDVMDGGAGNDTLYGEAGNDTYIFGRDSGQDVIIDSDPTTGNADTIGIGSNLTPNDITIRRIGNDLIVRINDTRDQLTVKDFLAMTAL